MAYGTITIKGDTGSTNDNIWFFTVSGGNVSIRGGPRGLGYE